VDELKLAPGRKTANFSWMFLLMGNRMEMGGIRISLTKDFTRSVKMEARLEIRECYQGAVFFLTLREGFSDDW
jgi:hypothetical protein